MEQQLQLLELTKATQSNIIVGQRNIIDAYKEKERLSGAQTEVREEELELWKRRYRKEKKMKYIVGGGALGILVLFVLASQ